MSHGQTSLKPICVLAAAIQLALTASAVHADEAEPKPFPAFADGHYVSVGTKSEYHDGQFLAADAASSGNAFCSRQTAWKECNYLGYQVLNVPGEAEKGSSYSKIEITLGLEDEFGEAHQETIGGGITLVRSCPVDSAMVADSGVFLENRSVASGQRAVACVSPDSLPKTASMGNPDESGANQCPIGNAPTVGNPINPLTGTKIETAVDYMGSSASGLEFARTYNSGAFALGNDLRKVGARYPEGARIGARWRHTYDRVFVKRSFFSQNGWAYATALHLVREDGGETRFTKKGDVYVADVGERGTLREEPSGGWNLTKADLTVENYDDKGRMRSRVDPNGNVTTLHYDEITVGVGVKTKVLVRVSDRQGRELKLGYDRLGRIETLDTPDGRVKYSYSGDLLEGLDADLVEVSYPDGRKVRYTYDEPSLGGSPNHKLTGIIGGDGKRFATFRYDSWNRAIGSSHGDNLEPVNISSDEEGVKISRPGFIEERWLTKYVNGVVHLGGRTMKFRRESIAKDFDYLSGGGLVSRSSDYLGASTSYKYDADRRLEVERTEAEGTPVENIVRTTWHPVFDKPIRVDNGTHWEVLEYDVKGNLLTRREGGASDAADPRSTPWPGERVTHFIYDAAGRVLTVDGPLAGASDTVRYDYYSSDAAGCTPTMCDWRKGDLHTVTNEVGHSYSVLSYDGAGRPTASVDANGIRTDRTFDAMGRLTAITVRSRMDGVASSGDVVSRWSYNENGDVATFIDPDGVTLTYRYNSAHRLIEAVDSAGNIRAVERNVLGQVQMERISRADGTEDLQRVYEYDSQGFPYAMESSRARLVYMFDANGNFNGTEDYIVSAAYHRDALGRVDRVTESPYEIKAETSIAYDHTGQISTVVDPKSLSTGYLRNGLGDLLWRHSPDTGDTSYENDENGRPVRQTFADGRSVDHVYDAGGRLLRSTYSDGKIEAFTYDAAAVVCSSDNAYSKGRISTATYRDGSTSFCYDFAGRVTQKTQVTKGVRLDIRYAYTRAGRLSSITYPDNRVVTYTRDAAGNVTRVDVHLAGSNVMPVAAEVVADALGRSVQWMAGSRSVKRSLDGLGAVTKVADGRPDGLNLNLSYVHANVESLASGFKTTPVGTDSASRVEFAGAAEAMPGYPFGTPHLYTYDKTGNRLSWSTVPIASRRFVYAADSHRLLTAHKVNRAYDANGNTTSMGNREFTYDASGRMIQAKVNGVVEMNYAYDPFGKQVGRFIAGKLAVSLYDEAGHWVGDYDASGKPLQQIVWLGDLPLAALDGDAIRDIQTDQLGTPRVVVDRASDKAIWKWSAHGEPFGSDAPDEDPDGDGDKYAFSMRFPGQRYDSVTGLFQNGWRDYDPSSGRYIESDPIGLRGGVATYAYVKSNPYTRTDTSGLDDTAGMYNPSFWGRKPGSGPDYYTVSASLLLGSVSLTLTRSGTLYFGYGPAYGGPKNTVNPRLKGPDRGLGLSIVSGTLSGCDHSAKQVNRFVGGEGTGANAFYGLGGGISYNNEGASLETGLGTPGASYQVYSTNRDIGNIGVSW